MNIYALNVLRTILTLDYTAFKLMAANELISTAPTPPETTNSDDRY